MCHSVLGECGKLKGCPSTEEPFAAIRDPGTSAATAEVSVNHESQTVNLKPQTPSPDPNPTQLLLTGQPRRCLIELHGVVCEVVVDVEVDAGLEAPGWPWKYHARLQPDSFFPWTSQPNSPVPHSCHESCHRLPKP